MPIIIIVIIISPHPTTLPLATRLPILPHPDSAKKTRTKAKERCTDFLVTTFFPLMYLVEVEVDRKLPPPVGPPKLVLENWENLQHNNHAVLLSNSNKQNKIPAQNSERKSITFEGEEDGGRAIKK